MESHEVEAKTEKEAIQIIEKGSVETHRKSYDGDFDKNEDGSILYTLEGCEDE